MTIDRAMICADEFAPRTVIVRDDAGMAPTRRTELCSSWPRPPTKMIDDRRQRAAGVRVGRRQAAPGGEGGAHSLTHVMRQRDPGERAALARLHAGDPASYLGWAGPRIVVHGDSDGLGAARADWRSATETAPASALEAWRDAWRPARLTRPN